MEQNFLKFHVEVVKVALSTDQPILTQEKLDKLFEFAKKLELPYSQESIKKFYSVVSMTIRILRNFAQRLKN